MVKNIRVYRVMCASGQSGYEVKQEDGRGGAGYTSIDSVVKSVKYQVEYFLKECAVEQVTIDFRPFHDIECPSGFLPMHCFPLSDDEQYVFWQYFLGKSPETLPEREM